MAFEINTRFKEIRKLLKLNQVEFASSLQMKQGTISDIERNRIGVSSKVVKKLSQNHGVNEGWLYTGEGNKYIEKNDNLRGIDEGMMKGLYIHREFDSPELVGRESDQDWILLYSECSDLREEVNFWYQKIVDVQILITKELKIKIAGGLAVKEAKIMHDFFQDGGLGVIRIEVSTKDELAMFKSDLQTLIRMFKERFFHLFGILYKGMRKDILVSKLPEEID